MKTLSSSEVKQDSSSVIDAVEKEPIAISCKNREVAVVVSNTRYNERKRHENILYGKAAGLTINEGLAPQVEAEEFFDNL